MIPSSFNTVIISSAALIHNYTYLNSLSGDSTFLAMVKADGYGHGMFECARLLQNAGCKDFGVAELREAVLLRQSGVTANIYTMIGFDHKYVADFFDYTITPVVYDIQSLESLAQEAKRRNEKISIHLKVDTGMTRLGVYCEELAKLLECISKHPQLKLAGLASHFPCSDDVKSPSTHRSLEAFRSFYQKHDELQSLYLHISNSGGILSFPEAHLDMVRCGIALYGYHPDGSAISYTKHLQPVMSFTTRVLQVKTVESGVGVSYGHTYITNKRTELAVLPVGYEDGFSRALSNKGVVLVRGKRAKVRGRVCMNLCMVDVTDIDGVQPGDEVVVLGKQGDDSISADEIAKTIDSISYEVLCMIGNNNERVIQ